MDKISLCANTKCPLKETCYRYMALPDPKWQPYGDFQYKKDKDGKVECNNYMILKVKAD